MTPVLKTPSNISSQKPSVISPQIKPTSVAVLSEVGIFRRSPQSFVARICLAAIKPSVL